MRLIILRFVWFVFLATIGCAGALHWDTEDITIHQTQVWPSRTEDKALVYFYRPPIGDPSIYAFPMIDGDTIIGPFYRGTYFYYYAIPREHTFWVNRGGIKTFITLNLENMKTYYIRCLLGEFTSITESVALTEIMELKYVTAEEDKLKKSITPF